MLQISECRLETTSSAWWDVEVLLCFELITLNPWFSSCYSPCVILHFFCMQIWHLIFINSHQYNQGSNGYNIWNLEDKSMPSQGSLICVILCIIVLITDMPEKIRTICCIFMIWWKSSYSNCLRRLKVLILLCWR